MIVRLEKDMRLVERATFDWYLARLKTTREQHANVINYMDAEGKVVAQAFDNQRFYVRR